MLYSIYLYKFSLNIIRCLRRTLHLFESPIARSVKNLSSALITPILNSTSSQHLCQPSSWVKKINWKNTFPPLRSIPKMRAWGKERPIVSWKSRNQSMFDFLFFFKQVCVVLSSLNTPWILQAINSS